MDDTEIAARLNDLREDLNERIDELIEEATGEDAERELQKKVKLLQRIHDEGGTVSQERFHEIGQELGYDKRGLGGLFSWKSKGARLQKVENHVSGDTEMVLTREGIKYLKRKGVLDE